MRVVIVLLAVSLFALFPRHGAAQEASPARIFVEFKAPPMFPEPVVPVPSAWQRSSTQWRYAGWGILAGAVAGAIWGTVAMMNAEEWIAPPAHIFTVPFGAVVGGVGGWVIGTVAQE